MTEIEIAGRAWLAIVGAGLAAHYGLMAVAARRAPAWIKAAYVLAAFSGFLGLLMALAPDPLALHISLWAVAVGAGAALVVSLKAWDAGVKMCEVMDSAAAMAAAHKVRAVVSQAQREAHVLGSRMTVSSWDQIASMEQDPRDLKRP